MIEFFTACLLFVVVIISLLSWSSWYQKTYWKWSDCENCGSMVYLHRERHVVYDRHPIWKGQCDICYNHIVEFIKGNS